MTCAVSDAKLTVALTPGIALSVRSMVATHEEHVIPPRLSVIGSRAVLKEAVSETLLVSVVWVIEVPHHLVKKETVCRKSAAVMRARLTSDRGECATGLTDDDIQRRHIP